MPVPTTRARHGTVRAVDGTFWRTAPVPDGVVLEPLLDRAMDRSGPLATTSAVVVVHHDRIVAERYQPTPPAHPQGEPVGVTTLFLSWSMAKSVLHAAVGLLVADGRLALDQPAAVPGWQSPGDPRRSITLDDLLSMRDGLDFAEDYTDVDASDVIEMLFGAGKHDVAGFAADRPLAAPPGTRFNYSSGTSNIVSGVLARTLGPGEPYRQFLAERLFEPIGAMSMTPTFDDAGTWIASTFLHATARDFARFGLLYLHDGLWEGRRILSEPWVETARHARSVDPTDGQVHSNHWWVDGGTFACLGYGGQSITVTPAADLVVVRLGDTPAERYPELREWRRSIVAAFTQAPS